MNYQVSPTDFFTEAKSNKSAQSNLRKGPRHGTVAHVHPIGPFGQWRTPYSPPKVPFPVDRSPNLTTCLIPGPFRPMVPNGIRIQSAIFPQCTGQADQLTDARTYVGTDRPTDRSFDDYRPLRSERTRAKKGYTLPFLHLRRLNRLNCRVLLLILPFCRLRQTFLHC